MSFPHRLGPFVALTVGLAGCAMPEEPDLSTASRRTTARDDDDKPLLADKAPGPTGAATIAASPERAAAPAEPEAPPAIDVTFAASDKQTYDGIGVARVCSDRGAHHQNATWVDAKWIELRPVDAPSKVLVRVEGEAFAKLKADVMSTGRFVVPVEVEDMPKEPKELAIIAGGDSRFATPADCKKASLAPPSSKQRDVEEFPNANVMLFNTKVGGTGCGIVGFVRVHHDVTHGKFVAQPSSQLLVAADDEGRGGFPKGSYYPACDGHDSPLVLDLGGHGVALSTPLAGVFDVDGDGERDDSPWIVSEDTPFLVRDANGNGIVDGVDEMFGNRTRSPDGLRASANGFEALARFDDTADGVIDGRDRVFAELRLWFDRNHDGRTDDGEIEPLEARAIRSIALGYVSTTERLLSGGVVQGAVRQRGGATLADGREVGVLDVWFHRRF